MNNRIKGKKHFNNTYHSETLDRLFDGNIFLLTPGSREPLVYRGKSRNFRYGRPKVYTPSWQSISITINIWIKINKRVIVGTVIDENLS